MLTMPKKPTQLGKRLKAIRKARGDITQRAAAAKIGVSYSLWISWEYGHRKPNKSQEILISLLEDGTIK